MESTDEGKSHPQHILIWKDLFVYVQMANVAHVAGEVIHMVPASKRIIVRLLHIIDEAGLLACHDRPIAKGYNVGLVREPDKYYNGAVVAFATEPFIECVGGIASVVFRLRSAGKSHCSMRNCVFDDECCNNGYMHGH